MNRYKITLGNSFPLILIIRNSGGIEISATDIRDLKVQLLHQASKTLVNLPFNIVNGRIECSVTVDLIPIVGIYRVIVTGEYYNIENSRTEDVFRNPVAFEIVQHVENENISNSPLDVEPNPLCLDVNIIWQVVYWANIEGNPEDNEALRLIFEQLRKSISDTDTTNREWTSQLVSSTDTANRTWTFSLVSDTDTANRTWTIEKLTELNTTLSDFIVDTDNENREWTEDLVNSNVEDTKDWVEDNFLPLAGGIMTGPINMSRKNIIAVGNIYAGYATDDTTQLTVHGVKIDGTYGNISLIGSSSVPYVRLMRDYDFKSGKYYEIAHTSGGLRINMTSDYMSSDQVRSFYPQPDNTYTLGKINNRWKNIYSSIGTYTDSLTVGGKDVATLEWANNKFLPLTGGTITGNLNIVSGIITIDTKPVATQPWVIDYVDNYNTTIVSYVDNLVSVVNAENKSWTTDLVNTTKANIETWVTQSISDSNTTQTQEIETWAESMFLKLSGGTVDNLTVTNGIETKYLSIDGKTAATQEYVNNAIGSIDLDIFIIVQTLPAVGLENKIYLVPRTTPEEKNVWDEYIWIDNNWELIGALKVDLTGFATEDWVLAKDYVNQTQMAVALATKADKAININAGTGLSGGGDLSTDRTLGLSPSGVTIGSYTKVTVDTYGRVTVGATLSATDIPDLSGTYVTLNTGQNIKGVKTFDNNIVLANNIRIKGVATDGVLHDLIYMSTVDAVTIGTHLKNVRIYTAGSLVHTTGGADYIIYHGKNANLSTVNWTMLNATIEGSATITGTTYPNSGIILPNGISLRGRDSSGNIRNLAYVGTGNESIFGSVEQITRITSNATDIQHNRAGTNYIMVDTYNINSYLPPSRYEWHNRISGLKSVVDLSGLDNTLYYPVVGTTITSSSPNGISHNIAVQLHSLASWSTRSDGMANAYLEVSMLGYGWGWRWISPRVLHYANGVGGQTVIPMGITQMGNSSKPVAWLRGGAKYTIYTNYVSTWDIKTSAYTYSEQTVEPTSTHPGTSSINFVIVGTDLHNVYHTGNANLSTVNWAANNLTAAGMSSLMGNVAINKVPVSTGYNLDVNGTTHLGGGTIINGVLSVKSNQDNAGTLTVGGTINANGGIIMPNDVRLQAKNTSGTSLPLVFIDTNNLARFGNTTLDTYINSPANNLIHHRAGSNYAILDAYNYNSYSPTLTGTGASGTWGISITGSAAKLGGVAYQNILERSYSGSIGGLATVGWYRIAVSKRINALGSSTILCINRAYNNNNNESYTFSINVTFGSSISITQLSGYANSRRIPTIRVDYINNGAMYIDFYYDSSLENSVSWYTVGSFESYTTATLVESLTGTGYEFSTTNGCKADRGMTLPNAVVLKGTTTSGSEYSILELNAQNNIQVGAYATGGNTLIRYGANLYAQNATNSYTIYHSGNSNLSTVDWSAKAIKASGYICSNGKTAALDGVAGVILSNGTIYITSDTDPVLSFYNNNATVTVTNRIVSKTDGFTISNSLLPANNNMYSIGTSSYRWANVYSILGNFSGDVTIGGNISGVGATLTGGIIVPYGGGSWINIATRTNIIEGAINQASGSAHGLYRVKTLAGNAVVFGGLGEIVGFHGFSAANIASNTNARTWATYWSAESGHLYHEKSLAVAGAVTFASTLAVTGESTMTGVIYANGGVILSTNIALSGKEMSGTIVPLIKLDSRNITQVGTQGYAMQLNTGAADITHNRGGMSYAILDTYNFSTYALPLSGGTITGSLTVNGNSNLNANINLGSSASIGKAFNSCAQYTHLSQYSGNPDITGIIKITLPVGMSNSMNIYEINIYEYDGSGGSKLLVSGYNYNGTDSRWYKGTVAIQGSYNKGVRLAYDGTNACILLGNTDTVWSYPKVYLTGVYSGHTSYTNWSTGYTITGGITSESGLSLIAIPTITDGTFNNISGSGITLTGGATIGGSVLVAGATKFASGAVVTGDITMDGKKVATEEYVDNLINSINTSLKNIGGL